MLPALHEIRETALKKSKEPPYIYKFFNIHGYYAGSGISGINRHIHPLVDAINERNTLPKYIIMVSDVDILNTLKKKGIAAALVMGKVIHYLIKQIDLLVKR